MTSAATDSRDQETPRFEVSTFQQRAGGPTGQLIHTSFSKDQHCPKEKLSVMGIYKKKELKVINFLVFNEEDSWGPWDAG